MAFNNLYPPIMDTYMPAFVVYPNNNESEDKVKISFSLSSFNSPESITSVWISVTNQYTNESVLAGSTGLLLKNFRKDILKETYDSGESKYYTYITKADLKDEKWQIGQNYKVQIRFSNESEYNADNNKTSWITENINNFSEWSTVCLIRPITKPSISIKGLDSIKETILTSMTNHIVGKFLPGEGDSESLESYNIKIYDKNDLNNSIYDSGIIYTNTFTPNEINYFLNCGYQDGVKYRLVFSYTTENLYTSHVNYDFLILDTSTKQINATINAQPMDDLGCIKVSVKSDNEIIFGGLTIKRTSSKTNFMIWEDVKYYCLTDSETLDLEWYDFSVESGVMYKYSVQKRDSAGNHGVAKIIKEPCMLYLEDMFLIGDNRALKIKFNPKVDSYSNVVSESSIQTIGSKYPFIKRNSAVQYKQFSISGLITHFMDEDCLFAFSKNDFEHGNYFHSLEECNKIGGDISAKDSFYKLNDFYKGYGKEYQKFNEDKGISRYNDFTLEKNFRQEVEKFLYNGKAKLFKSAPEGNIVVRLMNISLTPDTALGRLVYTFNATAYEIDDHTIKNLDKYEIQSLGDYNAVAFSRSEKSLTFDIVKERSLGSSLDIIDYIKKYEETLSNEDKIVEVEKVTELSIQFKSNPIFIDIDENYGYIQNPETPEEKGASLFYGYVIAINGKEFLIGEHGHFQIEGPVNSFEIVGMKGDRGISAKMEVTVFCKYTSIEKENTAKDAVLLRYYRKVGQAANNFQPTMNIIRDYVLEGNQYVENNSYERIASIHNISIEAEPYTLFYYKDASSSEYKPTVIGETGFLNLEDLDYAIDGLYCCGVRALNNISAAHYSKWSYQYYTRLNNNIEEEPIFNSIGEINFSVPISNDIVIYKVANLSGELKKFKENVNNLATTDNYIENLKLSLEPKLSNNNKEYYDLVYYNQQWCFFVSIEGTSKVILYPNYSIIDYCYELEKGEWRK